MKFLKETLLLSVSPSPRPIFVASFMLIMVKNVTRGMTWQKLDKHTPASGVYDSMVKSPNRAMLRATGMTVVKALKSQLSGDFDMGGKYPLTSTSMILENWPKRCERCRVAGQFGTITVAGQDRYGDTRNALLPWRRDIIADSIKYGQSQRGCLCNHRGLW